MLKRIKTKIPVSKVHLIAESIFNSKIRYGIAVYGNPKFDFKTQEQSMDPNLQKLQTQKLYNHLPDILRKITDPELYKELLKKWIWEEIPSV